MNPDTNILTSLAGGGFGAVILGVAFLLYKCLQGKKLLSKCCGAELSVQNESQSTIQSPQITQVTPAPSVVSTPQLKSTEEGRRVSVVAI